MLSKKEINPSRYQVAVVGSRKLSTEMAVCVRSVTGYLIERGYSIGSGGAMGADSAAIAEVIHRGVCNQAAVFAAFKVYASNDPNQAKEDYQQIAAYALDLVEASGLMYSDEWCFDSAYAAITDVGAGTFTVIEKHSP